MKKDKFSTLILILILIAGLSLLLYPSFSNYWNEQHSTKAIAGYDAAVQKLDKEDYSHLWEDAIAYNASLSNRMNPYILTDEQKTVYKQILDISGNGIMGYIEIPDIHVYLPIYHGTSEPVLQVAIGHLDWTSLPTGGENTHCALSGHRGLPSAKLFTDLDQISNGDIFILHVLDEVLTYEVDQIKIVEPHESEDLLIEEGKDLVTLVTCTPYGVNSHRLLVRGHRIENIEEAQIVRVTADAVIVEKLLVAPFILAPMLLIVLVFLLIPKPKKNRRDDL